MQFLEESGDAERAVQWFEYYWCNPTELSQKEGRGDEYAIDYYVRGTSWRKYMEEGPRILRDWAALFSWDSDLVLAREYSFEVPIGDGHTLQGTIDRLKVTYKADIDQWILQIDDYKSNKKTPVYDYLAEDLQFSAYCYATTQREFWENLPGGRGLELMASYADYPRYGRWIQLTGPRTLDAGPREERHYNRLAMACNAFAQSYALRIFVPTISGDSCRYCEFRRQCGLPELVEEASW